METVIRWIALATASIFHLSAPACAQQKSVAVSDIIQSSRFMTDGKGDAVAISPNGLKFVAVTVTGDVTANTVVLKLYVGRTLGDVGLEEKAALRTSGYGPGTKGGVGASVLSLPGKNMPRWSDNDHVVLYWTDANDIRQVVEVNVETGSLRYLTHEPRDVANFALSSGKMVYAVHAAFSSTVNLTQESNGYAVTAPNLIQLLSKTDPYQATYTVEYRVMDLATGNSRAVKLGGKPFIDGLPIGGDPQMSPNGRAAAVIATLDQAPLGWERFGTEVSSRVAAVSAGAAKDGLFARQLHRAYLIDVDSAQVRYLNDAPLKLFATKRFLAWSPDSKALAMSPAHLENGEHGLGGGDCTVVIDVSTFPFKSAAGPCTPADDIRWDTSSALLIDTSSGSTIRQNLESSQSKPIATTVAEQTSPTFSVEQDPNSPPVLVRRVGSSREILLDPNPGLQSRFRLAQARPFTWTDAENRQWTGTLYLAPGRKGPGPIVFQTRGPGTNGKFSLTGYQLGLGPFGMPYLAQPLSGQGVSVLQIPDLASSKYVKTPADRGEFYRQVYDAAYAELVRLEIADPRKVGLMGFSQSGWWVLYTVTHSTVPYAGVVIVDSSDGSYWQAVMMGLQPVLTEMSGGYPDGRAWKDWLNLSPAFNVGRIRCPVLLVATSAFSDIGAWEVFARMRAKDIPVELFVAPRYQQGDHVLQNPAQIAGVANRVLAWWEYWLLPVSVTTRADAPENWKLLDEQRRVLDSVPRPPLAGELITGAAAPAPK